MEKVRLTRKFQLEKNGRTITLDDPDPSMTTEEVMNSYANIYPELVSSTVIGPEYQDDNVVYRFKTVVGTKG